MSLTLSGTIVAKFEKQQVTDTFAKRDFVIETDDQYPQTVKFELSQNKCEDLDNFKVGDDVTVHFNVRGRKWTNKQGEDIYFVSLNAWKIQAEEAPYENDTPPADLPPIEDGTDDDLPF